jgi:hypothetical protein
VRKLLSILALLAALSLACSLPFKMISNSSAMTTPAAPKDTQLPATAFATEMPGDLTAAPTPAAPGNGYIVGNISFVIPIGLATTASHEVIARAVGEQVAPWDIAPEHTVLTLEDYILAGRQLKPQIFIYPAADYAALNQGVAENIKKIKALTSGVGMDVNNDTVPHVPFFNAGQVLAANTQTFNFRNGAGIRFLTQYSQDISPVTNNGLFYHFEGLTSDEKYYIVAIFPVNSTVLAEGNGQNNTVPEGGVPFPDYNNPNANFPAYFDAATQKLNSMPTDSFHPVLTQLDALIQTLQVTP